MLPDENKYEEKIEIDSIKRIDVKDGDVLAVFVKGRQSAESLILMKQKIANDFLPSVVKVEIFNAEIVDMKVFRVVEQ